MTRLQISRRLTADERRLLLDLLAASVAIQAGVTIKVAAETLGDLAEQGLVRIHGDDDHAVLTVNGHPLVDCTRQWLTFAAAARRWETEQ